MKLIELLSDTSCLTEGGAQICLRLLQLDVRVSHHLALSAQCFDCCSGLSIFACQLLHPGLRALVYLQKDPAHDFDLDWYQVAPSQIPPGEYPNAPMPKELEEHEIEAIFERRCQSCHAQTPTQPGFIAPPGGVVLDTSAAILANLQKTALQLRTRAMPIGNLTQMTEEERMMVLKWIEDGAPH